MPEIYLYAELLIHIRQLTLYASVANPKSEGLEGAKLFLSSDKKIINVLHDGQMASIYLPTQISGTADVKFPLERRTEVSGRLVFEDVSELEKAVAGREEGVECPWGAGDLGEECEVRCKECKSVLVREGRVRQWKDLPSENWADLMDLWFCHKPHEEGLEEESEKKGFGARSKLDAGQGVGLVDVLSLLVHEEDCEGVKASSESIEKDIKDLGVDDRATASENTTFQLLTCAKCSAFLGSLPSTPEQEGYRLHKSRLSIQSNSYPSTIFIGAQLLHLIQSSISRRIIVHSNTGASMPSPGLLIWIFNPDIYYSSSWSPSNPSVIRAMKVFYKQISNPLEPLDAPTSTVEELLLPEPELSDFQQALESTTQILPLSARTFNADKEKWDVGLVERWEKKPSGRDMMDGNVLNKKAPEEIKMQMNEVPEGWKELFS